MQHDDALVRRHHQLAGVGGLKGARLQVAAYEVDAVADDEGERRPDETVAKQRRRDHAHQRVGVQAPGARAEHGEDDHAVHEAEHAVVESEEKRQPDAGAARDEPHARDGVDADDQVLEPEEQHQRQHLPLPEQHAGERHQVGDEQRKHRDIPPPRRQLRAPARLFGGQLRELLGAQAQHDAGLVALVERQAGDRRRAHAGGNRVGALAEAVAQRDVLGLGAAQRERIAQVSFAAGLRLEAQALECDERHALGGLAAEEALHAFHDLAHRVEAHVAAPQHEIQAGKEPELAEPDEAEQHARVLSHGVSIVVEHRERTATEHRAPHDEQQAKPEHPARELSVAGEQDRGARAHRLALASRRASASAVK